MGNAKRLNILRGDMLRFTVVALVVSLRQSNSAFGQWMGKQTGCYADAIAANPNRPTVTNPAHVTQYGVLELKYGWDRLWPEQGIHQRSIGALLKFGMLCDGELRWNRTSLLSQIDARGTYRTFGDNWLGTEIRVHRQTKTIANDGLHLCIQKYLRPVQKMDWAQGVWITHSPSWLARVSRISISISVSPNSLSHARLHPALTRTSR